jgi:type VI protein secretion system component VasF
MFRSVLFAALISPVILAAATAPALANECVEAAQRVKKDARAANISPQLVAQVSLAIQKALDRRKSGDHIGCLSGVEAARKIFEAQ